MGKIRTYVAVALIVVAVHVAGAVDAFAGASTTPLRTAAATQPAR